MQNSFTLYAIIKYKKARQPEDDYIVQRNITKCNAFYKVTSFYVIDGKEKIFMSTKIFNKSQIEKYIISCQEAPYFHKIIYMNEQLSLI